ncbi:GPR endopeptidase [Paenibacillus physcomitrellae]|uniref:Germination protease n=1 Tax=Paenibacillus physcomitrellae TaxID=1619311 RepID=A0ABQ1FMR7_9BACL|nr:GPR endopeptidase [Paenibacillus physcomitrellae]GGA20277.1 germination protease [Paenibacillus physcomitrellae]
MELDLQKYNVRTDLAVDAKEIAEASYGGPIPGLNEEVEEHGGIKVTRIDVTNEAASQRIGRVPGHYITVEVPGLRNQDTDLQERVARTFVQEFSGFLQKIGISSEAKILVVGLGNWNVTPDSLGPLVVENILVTRHYFELAPEQVNDGYREVSAVAPGVLGLTGIESSDVVKGIVDRIKPDAVIAIDALASKSLERVNTTIQIADIGIHPGSGVGNKRRGLTKDILGVPCIAIGVPTVCYASTIVGSVIDMMKQHFSGSGAEQTKQILGMLPELGEQERLMLVKEVLQPLGHDVVVTPKEIDEFVEDIANVIASGLNAALHQAVNGDNVASYTH